MRIGKGEDGTARAFITSFDDQYCLVVESQDKGIRISVPPGTGGFEDADNGSIDI